MLWRCDATQSDAEIDEATGVQKKAQQPAPELCRRPRKVGSEGRFY